MVHSSVSSMVLPGKARRIISANARKSVPGQSGDPTAQSLGRPSRCQRSRVELQGESVIGTRSAAWWLYMQVIRWWVVISLAIGRKCTRDPIGFQRGTTIPTRDGKGCVWHGPPCSGIQRASWAIVTRWSVASDDYLIALSLEQKPFTIPWVDGDGLDKSSGDEVIPIVRKCARREAGIASPPCQTSSGCARTSRCRSTCSCPRSTRTCTLHRAGTWDHTMVANAEYLCRA